MQNMKIKPEREQQLRDLIRAAFAARPNESRYLVALETMNRAGGGFVPLNDLKRIAADEATNE